MKELRNYDDAVIKFDKKLRLNALPILSWDFYSAYFKDFCATFQDYTQLSKLATDNSWNLSKNLIHDELVKEEHIVVVTDANLNIVYATENIWKMNQYRPEQIIGKKPKIFQGEKTSKSSLKIISDALKENKPFETTVINYRKDGSTYNCWIKGQPIFNQQGKVVNFIAFEREVA